MNPDALSAALEKARLIELRLRATVQERLWGGFRSVFRGAGMDFEEVREYVPGDDIRAIDWSVTARAGKPFVKQFRQERELAIYLAIDVSASGEFGSQSQSKRELAAELACVLALAALRSHDKVGLLLFSDRVERFVPARSGRGHVLRLVQELLSIEPAGEGTNVARALDYLNQVTHRRSAVVLVSDFHIYRTDALAELERAVHVTSRRHELLGLWLTDPHEAELPNVGRVTLQDAETGELISLDTTRRSVREAYKNAVLQHRNAIRQLLRAANARCLSLSTAQDYMPALIGLFSGRASEGSMR